jgi:hypothetical protein
MMLVKSALTQRGGYNFALKQGRIPADLTDLLMSDLRVRSIFEGKNEPITSIGAAVRSAPDAFVARTSLSHSRQHGIRFQRQFSFDYRLAFRFFIRINVKSITSLVLI